jgi:hypothetical protein
MKGLTEEEFETRELHRYHMCQVYHHLNLALQVKQIEMAERIQEYLWEHNNTKTKFGPTKYLCLFSQSSVA